MLDKIKPILGIYTLIYLLSQAVVAQVVRDGSIGPSTTVQATGPNFIIPETFGSQQGGNLFHSFSQFSLNSSESATFTGNNSISNIITRVTGNNISNIDGQLTSTINAANFFLINPNGVLLGANAEINIDGSFNLSTADYIAFSNADRFNVAESNTPILSPATPSAFGFLSNNPNSITLNNSQLNLSNNTRFSIVAGDINVNNSNNPAVILRGGEILLASVASAGEVAVSLNPELNAFSQLGLITLMGEEDIIGFDVSGDPNGSVVLRGAVLNTIDFSLISMTEADTMGAELAIDIKMRDAINLFGSSLFSSPTEGSSPAGNLSIESPMIVLNEGSEILSDSSGTGTGGNILLSSNSLVLNGDAEIASDAEDGGNGGNIIITTRTLTLNDESEISTDTNPLSLGMSGSININADEKIRLNIKVEPGEQAGIFVNSEGSNDAGNIVITTDQLDIEGGSVVASSDLSNGGNVNIESTQLRLKNGEITANVNDGNGGNVTINSDTVILNSSQVVAQAGTGQGGEIIISGQRFFSAESLVSASAGPAGISGSVEINAPDVNLSAGLMPLSAEIFDAGTSLKDLCAAQKTEGTSSFTVATLASNAATIEGFPINNTHIKNNVLDAALTLSNSARQLIKSSAEKNLILLTLKQADAAIQSLPENINKIHALIHLARSYHILNTTSFSTNNSSLKPAYTNLNKAKQLARQLKDKRAYSFVMGNLALLYQSENLIPEALFLAQQASHAAEQAHVAESAFRWYGLQGQLLWQQGKRTQAIASYRRALDLVEKTRQDITMEGKINDINFHHSIAPVYQNLVSALLQQTENQKNAEKVKTFLLEARNIIEQYRASELRNYFNDPCIASVQTKTLDTISSKAAIIYPILLKDRTELLVSLPDSIHRYSVAVGKQQLTALAADFRKSIQEKSYQLHLTLGKQLFEHLVKPYLHELQEFNIETLVFVPGGILRNIPFAALYDGSEYLIQKYSMAMTPGLNLIDPHALNRSKAQILLAGISVSVKNLPDLPMVANELKAIQGLMGGNIMLNSDFTKQAIKQAFVHTQANIVHIASHAIFSGKPENNFILAYDGPFTLDELAESVGVTKYRKKPLELLVLSACQTAAGDEQSVLGLAGAAIKSGARSAIGSLWEIADEAAFDFYLSFYKSLKNSDLSKAAAIQKAQIDLLKHKEFSHPYYWAPFLLINNWL